jgi:dipeptidyl aminopeptidase/acylaminoacyl peptidase
MSDSGDVVAFSAASPQHPAELFVMTDGMPERVTDTNAWLADKRLAPQEVIEFEARDGLMLQGMLIRPLDYEGGERVPLIMIVHGGPESHYSNTWLTAYSLLGQMAAAKGYAVFYPNYRGSTGRGVAFSKTSQAEPAGAEFDDLVDGVEHLVEIGLVDADRVGVTGGSYGGYATGWLATRYTERFAAGVMFVGISNKVSKVGTTDIPNEEFLVHARKRPWDNWQFFLERSPIYYADDTETPLLIMHGAEDPRVHPTQSMELYRHLKLRSDAPVRLVFYPGEGHGNRKATARFDYTLRAFRWFDHYLMGPGGEPPAIEIDALAERERMMMGSTMDDAGSN